MTRPRPLLLLACASAVACGGGSDTTAPDRAPASITVEPAAATVVIGQTQAFSAVAQDAAGNPLQVSNITWASSTSAVATIGADGVAHSVAAGTTEITAAAGGVTSAPATLTVVGAAIISIEVSPPTATIRVGQSQVFTATAFDASHTPVTGVTFTWVSSNPSVAPISSTGVAQGSAVGTTAITASAGGVTSEPAALRVTDVQGLCDGIEQLQTWNLELWVRYNQEGTSAEGHPISVNHFDTLVTRLDRLVAGPVYADWIGVPAGSAKINDSETIPEAQGTQLTVQGGGPVLTSDTPNARAVPFSLRVNLETCEWMLKTAPWITATSTIASASFTGPVEIDRVQTGWLTARDWWAGMPGDQAFLGGSFVVPAHSAAWATGVNAEAGVYIPIGLGEKLFPLLPNPNEAPQGRGDLTIQIRAP